ncbi:FCD domain-containing protein [Mycolicibacterium diernhoferi]|uniref:FCD domain-containing protein n=1 Tax=Mycolicibacterium diernhoferi TaxID=1801 RepID=UPI0013F5A289|nr:FCD domain-containing protein [Mycolicibacterium diernhoferi]QYL23325.1 FCD domain-containing protein [Mycolicibacterium diernhoferi]
MSPKTCQLCWVRRARRRIERHSLDEHEALLDALGEHDAETARAIAERHVLDAGRSLAEWLAARREN